MKARTVIKGKIKSFSIILSKEDGMFVAWNPELDVADQGKTIEEAKKNLMEAIKIHVEEFGEKLPEKEFIGVSAGTLISENNHKVKII